MKALYSSLHCPHCGSSSFELVKEDVFLCDYCNQKFNYDLNEIEFTSENKVFIQELKDTFCQKINDLESEKAFYKQKVIHYSKLANSKKVSRILLVLSILSLSVSYGVMGLFFISFLIPLILSLALFGSFIFVRKKENKKYKEYMPMASYYASKVVSLEDEITVYTKLLSKLTK
ncbi:MAG: hypothetical protein IJY57_02275 [Clostridia bacterium]|nr:hypothetical protein [Clostridia bacterium]